MKTGLIILSCALVLAACSSPGQTAATKQGTGQAMPEAGACCGGTEPGPLAADTAQAPMAQPLGVAVLPRLVDLGATTCKPCIMMEPVLESLREQYAGKMSVEFIDVRANPAAAKPYGISSIPTQIYFDASGTERWRHVGFISEDDLLAAITAAGVELPALAAKE